MTSLISKSILILASMLVFVIVLVGEMDTLAGDRSIDARATSHLIAKYVYLIRSSGPCGNPRVSYRAAYAIADAVNAAVERSEEHTSELQSQSNLVCRLLLEKKKTGLLCIPRSHAAYDLF